MAIYSSNSFLRPSEEADEPDKLELRLHLILARNFQPCRTSFLHPIIQFAATKMPHKHTRKGENKSTYVRILLRGSYILIYRSIDLPPTIIAKPLPVAKSSKSNGIFTTDLTNIRKRKRRAEKDDDTPKAFARLMSFRQGKRLPKGLDDGLKITKKQKQSEAQSATIQGETATKLSNTQAQMPTIQPGERMADFAARVDAALPLSGLMSKTAKGGKDPLGLKVARTKKEKKMHRMYDEWREQDRKIKEKRQEAQELAQEEDGNEELGVRWKVDMEVTEPKARKKGKGKKSNVIGEVNDGEDDPWAAIARSRNEEPKRLNDVVQAPPDFTKLPKEKFKVRGAKVYVEDVPKASGSLRRREELVEIRRSVVEGYRQMMKDNKAAARQ